MVNQIFILKLSNDMRITLPNNIFQKGLNCYFLFYYFNGENLRLNRIVFFTFSNQKIDNQTINFSFL